MSSNPERKALYPGSFDPPTNGHKWVMERMANDYNKGIVAIGYNPDKPSGRFPVPEREEMLLDIVSPYPNLTVTSFLNLYQADFVESVGAQTIIRGMRSTDFDNENTITQINRDINPEIETVFKIPPNELQQVSSSMVMGLVGFEGWKPLVSRYVPEVVFERIKHKQEVKDKETLEKKWNDLYTRLGAKGDSGVVFDDLIKRYTEPHRHYHGLDHLKTGLNELELVRNLADNPNAAELAYCFHDADQESSKPPNPSHPHTVDDVGNSTELAVSAITGPMQLSKELADEVASLITVTNHTDTPKSNDQKLVVDIDLAIFGRSKRIYDIYEDQIRQEYAWVPEDIFREKRAEVLETFLPPHRPSVYHTQFFQERYGEQAEKNLHRAITNLRNP